MDPEQVVEQAEGDLAAGQNSHALAEGAAVGGALGLAIAAVFVWLARLVGRRRA